MFHLDDCSAIITGASSGLGAEFARQLAPRAGALVLVARRMAALEQVREELLAARPELRVHLCASDLATEEGRGRLVEDVVMLDWRPNLLVNNAGMGDYGTVASADADRLRTQIELNVAATVLLTHALLPLMRRPAGVLNVSSLASMLPLPDMAVYAASKAFVTSFSEALAVELKAEGVSVSCVCPGPTPTNFGKAARREDGTDTDRSGQDLLRIPPQEVVRAALAGLVAGRPLVFPGWGVAISARLFRLMPRGLLRWQLQRRFARAGR